MGREVRTGTSASPARPDELVSVRIITALYKRTESGINGGTARAPLRASGPAAWIRNLLSLSQNALISATARAVKFVELGRPENEIKEHEGTSKGHAKERAGITKDTQGTTSTFSLHRTLFSAKPARPCLPTSSLRRSTGELSYRSE